MKSRDGFSVGIDVGGTKTAMGLVSSEGVLLDYLNFETQSSKGIPDAARRMADGIHGLLQSAGLSKDHLVGIGMGCPGPLDLEKGLVRNPYTLPGWETGSLTDAVADATGMPVRLENDADAALLGECWVGAGQGRDPVMMLTFGTGVGGALLCQGRLLRGARGEHPEIGLIPVQPGMAADYSGVEGSLESLASGGGIAKRAKAIGFMDAQAVFEAADQGHAAAKALVQDALSGVSVAAWIAVHAYHPECIILGGGLMDHHFELYAQSMRQAITRAVLVEASAIEVVAARLGNQAGMLGAASLWLRDR